MLFDQLAIALLPARLDRAGGDRCTDKKNRIISSHFVQYPAHRA
jgi:hypothetical protein